MKLFFRDSGKGEPLIILHGLYGSSDNWVSISKEFEKFFRVILVDQRNHGQSPHSEIHNYNELVNDLLELFNFLNFKKAKIIGHSMGGKVAMQFAIDHPERVDSLIIVDISPWSYINSSKNIQSHIEEHKQIIAGLSSIPITSISSRGEAEAILSKTIKSEPIRQFLLKNLKRGKEGSFSWRFNLSVLANSLDNMIGGITPRRELKNSSAHTLFIKGSLSNYIPNEKTEELKRTFPNSEVQIINEAGHWVHAEKPEEFLDLAFHFLLS